MSQQTLLSHQRDRCVPAPSLQVARLPGEFGLILRCYGELSVATAEALRREIALVDELDHPVLMLNLSACRVADSSGLLIVFQSFVRLRERGARRSAAAGGRLRLVIITGARELSELLGVSGIDKLIPSFPTEEAAALSLRGWWPPLPGPRTWEEARADTIVHWKVVREALEHAPQAEALQLLTSMTGLCECAEELYQENPAPGAPRCLYCPLFHALGGAPGDVGCRSRIDPILAAVRAGDQEDARAGVDEVIRLMEKMTLPVEDA
jgi:anti-anti-sigma regulatory factor